MSATGKEPAGVWHSVWSIMRSPDRRITRAAQGPMMPARHCAITKSAVEAMNIGPAMTGIRNLAFSCTPKLGFPVP